MFATDYKLRSSVSGDIIRIDEKRFGEHADRAAIRHGEKLRWAAPDVFVQPDVGRFRVLDFWKAAEIWEATATAKDEFKRQLDVAVNRAAKTERDGATFKTGDEP